MGKDKSTKIIGLSLLVLAIAAVTVIIMLNVFHEDSTGDITISGAGTVTGIKCVDTELNHPVFADVQPLSHQNTITANFVEDKLTSIMYKYEGTYQSAEEASEAKVLAEADYNLILAREYDEPIDVFSHLFMADDATLSLTITGSAGKATARTAPYFLLDSSSSFPTTMKTVQAAYETKGFSCTVEKS